MSRTFLLPDWIVYEKPEIGDFKLEYLPTHEEAMKAQAIQRTRDNWKKICENLKQNKP